MERDGGVLWTGREPVKNQWILGNSWGNVWEIPAEMQLIGIFLVISWDLDGVLMGYE